MLRKIEKNRVQIKRILAGFLGLGTSAYSVFAIIHLQFSSRMVFLKPNQAYLHYNDALALFLCGIILFLILSHRKKWSNLLSIVISLYGFCSLLEALKIFQFGIQFSILESLSVPIFENQALSPSLALSFFLSGLASNTLERSKKFFVPISLLLNAGVFGIAVVGYFGYVANLSTAYTWASYPPLSFAGAFGICLFSLGLFSLQLERLSLDPLLQRRWLPPLVGFSLSFSTLLLTVAVSQHEQARVRNHLQTQANEFAAEISRRIELQIAPLMKMADRWPENSGGKNFKWKNDLQAYIEHFPSYHSIEQLDLNLKRTLGVSRETNELSLNPTYSKYTQRKLLRTLEIQDAMGIRFISPQLGFKRFFIAVPLIKQRKSVGLLVGTFRIVSLFETVTQDKLFPLFSFEVLEGTEELYSRNFEFNTPENAFDLDLNLYGIKWKLRVWPIKQAYAAERSFLVLATLVVGLLAASLLSFLFYYILISNERSNELEVSHLELTEANQAVLKTSHYKSEFLANMSHEIRTPMNAVIGMTHLLLDSKLNEEQRDCAETIRQSADSLLSVINDVLDFSKIEAGKMELESIDFELFTVVKGVCDLLRHEAQRKKIELIFWLDPRVSPWFKGDPGRLRQILMNLTSNAIKFTSSGSVKIEVKPESESEQSNVLIFSVIDTGVGISEFAKPKIFGSFSQADTSTTREFGGTGLGLSICKKLTEMMNGEIGFSSTEGAGSIFWFRISLATGNPIETKKSKFEKHAIPKSNRSIHILVAEDNAINRKVAAKSLGRMGFLVDTVTNGKEALESLDIGNYDLILMDCQMPVMDGYEAATLIRQHEFRKKYRIPIVALTAHAMTSDRKKCMDAGMDGYLTKPFEAKALKELIETLVEQRRAQETTDSDPPSETQETKPKRSKESKENPKTAPVKTEKQVDIAVLEELLALEDNGTQFLRELLDMFRESTPKNIELMRTAIKKQDSVGLANLAHSLKSSSGNLGAVRMRESCKLLEDVGKSGELKNANSYLAKLERVYAKTIKELDNCCKALENSKKKAA